VPADVLADVSESADKMPIEIGGGHGETRGEKSADCALARSARADQANHRIASDY
jgi:hypothetical protein